MTKHVYIIVHGEHVIDGIPQEPVEVRTEGRYYQRGGHHYVLYEEFQEDTSKENQSGQNTIKINSLVKFDEKLLEIHRRGGTESVMRFEKDKMHVTQYHTPAGILELGTMTNTLTIDETPHKVRISVDYELHAGGSKVQDSRVTITVIPYPVI